MERVQKLARLVLQEDGERPPRPFGLSHVVGALIAGVLAGAAAVHAAGRIIS